MLEQAEQLVLPHATVDVVKELERRLRAPAEEKRGKRVRGRPPQDIDDLGPKVLLFDPWLQRVDAGDDEAVELPVLDFAEGAVEFADVLGRRVAGLSSGRDALHVAVRRDEAEMDLEHRVAGPKGQF